MKEKYRKERQISAGGIMNATDAIEFLMAGADAVSIGTAAFANPTAPVDIRNELIAYMQRYGFKNLQELKDAFQG